MRIKRLLALLLTVAALCGTLAPATFAASETKTKSEPFTDIYDADTNQAAELLRLLGIVNGTGGTSFSPDKTLSRAEFCKMAVELMGNGNKVAAQMNRTIFKDVPSTHWARGFIHVATQGSTSGSGEDAASTPGIIRGDGSGNFYPDNAITYEQAVTILMRVLGYSDSTVGFGGTWSDGYLNTAKSIGLTEGLSLTPASTLTRGQAALLMDHLLHTEKRGEKDDYMVSVLKCELTDEVLIFDTNATAPDGSTGSVKVEEKTYKTDRAPFPEDLIGRRAKLLLDEDKKVLSIEPSTQGTSNVVDMLSFAYTYVKSAGGDELKVKPETVVWKDGEKKTYKDLYQSLTSGTQALFHYAADGELEYIFLRTSKKLADQTQVVTSTSSVNTAYKVYKNGVPATSKDIRQYDVTTYDSVNEVVYISDLRLTGIYQNAYPSPDTPVTVKVLGCEFAVLDSAFADLTKFKIGDQVTLLFSYDGKVAGAVDPKTAKSTTVGVVKGIEGSTATVDPINDSLKDSSGKKAVLTGETSYKGTSADAMVGQLVTVSASQKERITLSKLSGSGAKASLKMADGTMGDISLAENVIFYERVGNSAPKAIDREQITVFTVPASKITYVHTNYAGDADIVVLDDVTGDVYEYGFLKYMASKVDKIPIYNTPGDSESGIAYYEESKDNPDTLTVKNTAHPDPKDGGYASTYRPKNDAPGGIVASLALSASGKAQKLEAYVLLTKVENVASTAFNMEDETVTVDGEVYPISRYVECYNKQTKTWFASTDEENNFDALNAARAFAQTLTVYYDKSPENGGKIRLVVVE